MSRAQEYLSRGLGVHAVAGEPVDGDDAGGKRDDRSGGQGADRGGSTEGVAAHGLRPAQEDTAAAKPASIPSLAGEAEPRREEPDRVGAPEARPRGEGQPGNQEDRGGAASRGICEVAQNVERREAAEGPIKAAAARLKAKSRAVRSVTLRMPVPEVGFLTAFTRSAAVWDRKPSSDPDKRAQFAGMDRGRISRLTIPGEGGRKLGIEGVSVVEAEAGAGRTRRRPTEASRPPSWLRVPGAATVAPSVRLVPTGRRVDGRTAAKCGLPSVGRVPT